MGAAVPHSEGAGSPSSICGLCRGLPCTKWRLDLSSRLATIDMSRKVGVLCPFGGGGTAGPSCNTMPHGPRPTSVPSGISIHPADWPQYTKVTNRQERQRSDSIRRTILETVAVSQKLHYIPTSWQVPRGGVLNGLPRATIISYVPTPSKNAKS